jgi:tRNA A-37 threonylcarbamoyl transferase component Bud32
VSALAIDALVLSGTIQTGHRGGALIDDRYEAPSLVDRGGVADVYRAWDRRLARPVALKMLRRELAGDRRFPARFRREARAAAALTHPGIAAVYDSGTHDGLPYIAMEYVEGRTLAEVLAEEGPLSAERVAEVGIAIAEALACAHAAGIVHRDLKPGNVMITDTGEVKVVDFGIAWAANWTPIDGEPPVQGTPEYLSPEQARGEDLDGRSDLYSLGVVLYELLTGRPPFLGEAAVAVAYRHLEEPPVPPRDRRPEIPSALSAIVTRALAKPREDRYPNAEAFRGDLVRLLRREPVSTAPLPRAEAAETLSADLPEGPPVRWRRWLRGVAASLVLLLVGTGLVLLVARAPQPPVPDRPPPLHAPTALTVQEECGGFLTARVTLRWASTSSRFADGYEVYRGTANGGPYERIGWIPGRDVTSYVDEGLRPGTTYLYAVRSTAGTRASAVSVQAETRTPFACFW